MGKIGSLLKKVGRSGGIYLDTNVFIYHLEDRMPYADLTQTLFDSIQKHQVEAHTSVLTILELNVKPYQMEQPELALQNIVLLDAFPHLFVHSIDAEMADLAARLRAAYRLKTPDALHVACALRNRCRLFLGNDRDLARVKEIEVRALEEFLRI